MVSIDQVAAVVAAATTISGGIFALVKYLALPAYRMIKSLAKAFQTLDLIRYQLAPNGGTTLRDVVDRIEQGLKMSDQRHRLLIMDSPFAVFEADRNGMVISVNRTYCMWVGRSADELMGNGWLNVLATGSRDGVADEWKDAISDRREFSADIPIKMSSGSTESLACTASPMYSTKGDIVGWMGIMTKDKQGVEI